MEKRYNKVNQVEVFEESDLVSLKFQPKIVVRLIASASSVGWLRSSIAINILFSVNTVYFRNSIVLLIWTAFLQPFPVKF